MFQVSSRAQPRNVEPEAFFLGKKEELCFAGLQERITNVKIRGILKITDERTKI